MKKRNDLIQKAAEARVRILNGKEEVLLFGSKELSIVGIDLYEALHILDAIQQSTDVFDVEMQKMEMLHQQLIHMGYISEGRKAVSGFFEGSALDKMAIKRLDEHYDSIIEMFPPLVVKSLMPKIKALADSLHEKIAPLRGNLKEKGARVIEILRFAHQKLDAIQFPNRQEHGL